MPHTRDHGARFQGRIEELPLSMVTTQGYERLLLHRLLHAYGNQIYTQVGRQSDHGLDDGIRARLAPKRLYKRAIDLERIDREVAQTAQRGESGSEIVDADVDSQPLEFGQHDRG